MTSSSIQDISGLMYQKQVKGQKNAASDENDLSGMFQNAMNLAKDNSTLGSSDYGRTKDLSIEKQQGTQSLHTMVSGTQKTYDFVNRKDTASAMEKSQKDSYGNVDRNKEVRKSDADRAAKKSDDVNKTFDEKKTDANKADEEITDEKAIETEEKIVEKIAEELNVSEEDVKAAMEALGLGLTDLANQSNIALLVTELTADGDSLAMLTDENLFASIQDLTEMISDMLQEGALNGLQGNDGLTEEVIVTASEDDMPSVAMEDMLEHADSKETVLGRNVDYEIHQEDVTIDTKDVSGETVSKQSNPNNTSSDFSGTNQELTGNGEHQTMTDQPDASALVNPFDMTNAGGMDSVNKPDVAFSSNVNVKDIIDQIAEHVKISNSADFSEVEISLHPATLGNVHLQVSEKAGIITAVITTENETVRDALLVQAMALKEELNEQGLKVESVEVTIASHEFEQNMQRDEGQEARQLYEEQVNKQTRRRIMISGLEEAQEMLQDETLSDAERLQIDMMAKNGSSMDVLA